MNNKSVIIDRLNECPKGCGLMERRKHPSNWVFNKKRKSFYFFTEWDFCPKCRHVQLYEEFKNSNWEELENNQRHIFEIIHE